MYLVKTKSKIILALLLTFMITFLFISIFQITSLTSETKMIQNYENKLQAVNQENENLTIYLAGMNSLSNIQELTEVFGFERIGNVHHIKLSGDIVVIR